MNKRFCLIIILLSALVLASCGGNDAADRKEEMLGAITRYFEEPESRKFEVTYPVSVEGEDCYKIVAEGLLNDGGTYPLGIFAINPNTHNHYYYDDDTGQFQLYMNVPRFACSTSPDGGLRIESAGMFEDGPAGIHELKQIRIINLETGSIEWSKAGNLSNFFLWSGDGRFASAQFSGRRWIETIVVDTRDFSDVDLPGTDDILELFPGAPKPDAEDPMPMFSSIYWESPTVINIGFEWTADYDVAVMGEYRYDVVSGTISSIEIFEFDEEIVYFEKFPGVESIIAYLGLDEGSVTILHESEGRFMFGFTSDWVDLHDRSILSYACYIWNLIDDGYEWTLYDGTISSTHVLEKGGYKILLTTVSDIDEFKKDMREVFVNNSGTSLYDIEFDVEKIRNENILFYISSER